MSFADQPQLLFGDMELVRELGAGGMGKVDLYHSRSTGERFAVKRTKFRDWPRQRNFLLELMTWYGLPRHPHIVECRFFRTLPNDQTGETDIAIFAEYVPGGSLADWIKSGKLYESGPEKALERILDIAIQFAWGLQAAHELGVVHQDVKPGNVLLSPPILLPSQESADAPIVKTADFGLARARAMSGVAVPGQSAAVSAGFCTKEYCSPEQNAYDPRLRPEEQVIRLTRKTDIWSWAISILDMFTGEPNHCLGARAHRVTLKEALTTSDPPIPNGMVESFTNASAKIQQSAWDNMAEIAEALCQVYQSELGHAYPRMPPARAGAPPGGPRPPFQGRRVGRPTPLSRNGDAPGASGGAPAPNRPFAQSTRGWRFDPLRRRSAHFRPIRHPAQRPALTMYRQLARAQSRATWLPQRRSGGFRFIRPGQRHL